MGHPRENGCTIYELVRSQAYPVDALLKSAHLASSATSGDLTEILRDAVHPHPGVRYWAANALITLKIENDASHKILRKLLEDTSASVRLAAAEALYLRGERDLIRPIYELCLRHTDEKIRVHAATSLATYNPEFTRPFAGLVEELLTSAKKRDYDARALRHLRERVSQ